MRNSLRKKILFGFGIIFLIIIGLSTYSLYNLSQINAEVDDIISEQLSLATISDEMSYNMADRMATIRGYLLTGDVQYRDKYVELVEKSDELTEQLSNFFNENEDSNVLYFIHRNDYWNRYTLDEVIPEFEQKGKDMPLNMVVAHLDPIADEVQTAFQEIAMNERQSLTENANLLIEKSNSIRIASLIAVVIGFIITIIIAFFAARHIVNPIISVANQVEKVAKGDLTGKQMAIKSKDELGRLMNSVNEMVENLRTLLLHTMETSKKVATASGQLSDNSQKTVYATEEIASTTDVVAQSAQNIVVSSKESAKAMEEMAQGIQRISEATIIVTESAQGATEQSKVGNEDVKHAVSQMASISNSVQRTTHVMNQLSEKSKSIDLIVEIITNIAEQTNLLALNSAIEAARAGEHGKGFAVVAEEVRKLAEESRKSAEEIGNVIREIQVETLEVVEQMEFNAKEVEEGINAVNKAGDAFATINETIQNITSQIEEVSAVVEEMSASSEQVSASVEDMASLINETARQFQQVKHGANDQLASMQEISTSANQLSILAEELKNEVEKFKI